MSSTDPRSIFPFRLHYIMGATVLLLFVVTVYLGIRVSGLGAALYGLVTLYFLFIFSFLLCMEGQTLKTHILRKTSKAKSMNEVTGMEPVVQAKDEADGGQYTLMGQE